MPTSPAELVAAEPDPRERFRLVTVLARRRKWLSQDWAEQRLDDLRTLLSSGPDITQKEIAEENGLTEPRVSDLVRRAFGGPR